MANTNSSSGLKEKNIKEKKASRQNVKLFIREENYTSAVPPDQGCPIKI